MALYEVFKFEKFASIFFCFCRRLRRQFEFPAVQYFVFQNKVSQKHSKLQFLVVMQGSNIKHTLNKTTYSCLE